MQLFGIIFAIFTLLLLDYGYSSGSTDCKNPNEPTHCDISPQHSSCYTCITSTANDYSYVQQYLAYYESGNCDGLVMKISGRSLNSVYLYDLHLNQTINICSNKSNGGDLLEMKASVDYSAAANSEKPCLIGINLMIGTAIDSSMCN